MTAETTSVPARDVGGCPVSTTTSARRRLHGFHAELDELREQAPVLLEHVRTGRLLDGDPPRRGARGVPAPGRVLERLDRSARPRPGVPVHPDAGEPTRPRQVPPGPQPVVLAGRRRPHRADGPEDLRGRHRRLRRGMASATSSPTSPSATRPRCSSSILGLPVEDATAVRPAGRVASSSASTARTRRRSASAAESIHGYFSDVLADRRRQPGDPAVDFVTHLSTRRCSTVR